MDKASVLFGVRDSGLVGRRFVDMDLTPFRVYVATSGGGEEEMKGAKSVGSVEHLKVTNEDGKPYVHTRIVLPPAAAASGSGGGGAAAASGATDPAVLATAAALLQEERRLRLASERRLAVIKRHVAQLARINSFLGVLRAQLDPASGERQLAHTVLSASDFDSVALRGFAPSGIEDAVCAAAWARVREYRDKAPKGGDDELEVVHPFMARILNDIAAAAAAHGTMVNTVLSESAEEGRLNWVGVQPHETLLGVANRCFLVETVPRTLRYDDGTTAADRDTLLRVGTARLIHRLACRHRHMKDSTLGVGVVVNGADAVLVRIDFVDDGTDTIYPCYVTESVPLLRVKGDEACPTGLRWLVRLLLERDVRQFGLPLDGGFTAPPPYAYVRLLGEGGYGIVNEVVQGDGTRYALKCMRESSDDDVLEKEGRILVALQDAAVPRVPVFVEVVTSSSTPARRGLVMAPAGVPLPTYMNTHATTQGQRIDLARRVVSQVHATLCVAHAARILHGDVRPHNLIVVPCADATGAAAGVGGGAAGVDVFLIDWGIGDTADTSSAARPRSELHGVNAFMADERVRLDAMEATTMWTPAAAHDVHALLYTYAALVAHDPAESGDEVEPPWGCWHGSDALIAKRRRWLAEHSGELRCGLPDDLRPVWDDIAVPL